MTGAEQVCVKCSCGGTTTVNVGLRETTAVTECACGRITMWARGEMSGAPKMLGISVGDDAGTSDKAGG